MKQVKTKQTFRCAKIEFDVRGFVILLRVPHVQFFKRVARVYLQYILGGGALPNKFTHELGAFHAPVSFVVFFHWFK